jgi:hypothetical protein
MACIISRDSITLFISYAPGTGSTSLEQHLRTHGDQLVESGFALTHYPKEEFGVSAAISRHLSYREYLASGGECADHVATGIRNPFSYYFAEYKRILSKWIFLLDDLNSWIYSEESKSTLALAYSAKNADCFDTWLLNILIEKIESGYVLINEDHLDGASHFIKTENMTGSFDQIMVEIFGIPISEVIGPVPLVNASGYSGSYADHVGDATKGLALFLFGHYMSEFGYSYGDTA